MESTKKILAIITQDSVFEKMEPIFTRASMEVTRATSGTRSLILATNVRYDLIVAEYPLPDLSIVDFLEILQSPTLANAHSPQPKHCCRLQQHQRNNHHYTIFLI